MSAPVVADRYRILDRIGEGGIGVVYRVEDLVAGEIRALKVIPRASGRANLRAEFLALARLRHDNIIEVYDYGVTARGDDYFTMQLVVGRDLRAAAAAVGAPSAGFYQLIGGVLRALAFLHARGMVHADVKPSNVLVDDALLAQDPLRAAKLLDFGLAGATADAAGARGRGTFPYAAPEVYTGHLDARSDLYSLGILMYELVTGQSAFPGDDIADVIRRQRRSAPPDPRTLRAELPAGLAELILALTDPEPGARLQTADEVLARVAELGGTELGLAVDLGLGLGLPAGEVTRPHVDIGGTLIGRERDLTQLATLWDETRAGAGAVALLVGEEGIGKSRLLAELKLRVQLGGGRFLGASAAARPGMPYAGVADVVRGLLVDLGEKHPTVVGPRRAALAPLLAPLLGEQRAATGAAREGESRFALAEAVTGLILELAAIEPIAIALDDLQHAERGAVELFTYLARAAHSGRVLLVGGTRAEGDDPSGTTARLTTALAHVERGRRLDLPPLDRAACRAVVAGAFGPSGGPAIAEAFAAELHRASGGNPALLGRALEALLDIGAVARRRGEWILLEPNPRLPVLGDAVDAALARARALTPEARDVLDTAAVLGERFAFGVLVAVGGLGDEVVSEAIGAAIATRLVASESEGSALQFAQHGLREALLAELDPARRVALHRRAAVILEAYAAAGRPAPADALAEHYLAVGDGERGTRAALAAAEEHAAAFDHHGALAWLERVEPSAAVDERKGDMRAAIGELAEAAADYRRAHDAAAGDQAVLTQIRIAHKLCEALRRRGEGDEAIERLMKALGQARTARLATEEASCQHQLARVRMWRGEYQAALEHAAAGVVLSRAAGAREVELRLATTRCDLETFRGDPRAGLAPLEGALLTVIDETGTALTGVSEALLADLYHARGRASVHAGDYPRAVDSLERAIVLYARLGRVEMEAKARNNLGAACYFLGDWDRARSSWERFRHLCERLDDGLELVNALNNLGSLYRDRGELTEALAVLERGRVVAERTNYQHMGGVILGNRGDVLFRQGDTEGARASWERCQRLFESLGAREDLIEARRRLCEVDIATGRIEAALDRGIDAAREAQAAGAKFEEGILHRVVATALRLQGDLESATWFLERGREILTGLGTRYECAKVDLEAAELAAARGDLASASASLALAAGTLAALGARWDLARVRERKRALAPVAQPTSAEAMSAASLGVILDVARASGRVELEKLLEVVLDKILAVTRFDRGFILLLDERGRPTERKRRSRVPGGTAGADEFDRAESDFSGSVVRRVAQTGEPIAVTDVADDAALREQRSVVALGLRSVMCAPMRRHGRVTGIIYVDSKMLADEERARDLALLEALASQAAIAIENARLLSEEQRKTELMAILAHEIRNPLAGILGYSDLLPEERAAMGEQATELLTRVHRDGQRLKRLVDNVLELARVEAGKVEWSIAPLQLAELLEDTRSAYDTLTAKKGVKLSVDLGPDLPPAFGNSDRLFQVLSNLVGNALKFTPSGGAITLRARAEQLTRVDAAEGAPLGLDDLGAWVPLGVSGGQPSSFVRVDVVDTGPGIPAQRRAHLFEKFAQGDEEKRASRGVGLGLYISREIIRRHGGQIWVESEVGKGSSFSFRIPAGG